MPGGTITMVDPTGVARDVAVDQVEAAQMQGFRIEGADERADRVVANAKEDTYGTTLGKVGAFAAGVNRAVTFGASDAIGAAIDPDQARHYTNLREVNPGLSTAGELAGTLITALPTGGESILAQGLARTPGAAVGRLGASIAEAGEGASALSQIGRSAAGAAFEGAAYGVGSGVTELALSDKPIDVERIGSVLSSHMLYGGGVGAAAGTIGKVAELGLGRARTALASREAHTVTDDLAQMDVKQLRAAREAEVDAIKTTHKAETEALEATRAVDKSAIADDIAALRREIKDSGQWATTKGVKLAAAEGKLSAAELGRISMKAEKQLAGLLDNPIGLAKNPTKALDALQRQENALVKLLDHSDDLRGAYVTDALGGKRVAALEAAPGLLEKNRALQAKIAKVSEPLPSVVMSSPRLEAIEAAKEALQVGAVKPGAFASIPQRMVEGSAFGTVAGVVGGMAIPGAGMLAPLVGGAVSKFLGEKVFGKLGAASSAQAAKATRTAQSFLGLAEKGTKAATPIATKVLSSVRYAEKGAELPRRKGTTDLEHHYEARANEVRKLVEHGPDGKTMMREDARARVAQHLGPIGTQFPQLADALEELAARRVTFLADRLPKKPDMFANQLGPETWRPSDMEMRKWARYVAGVENPDTIMDRVVTGGVSPEDAEVMRKVYPEMLADLQQQIFEQAGTAKKTIPYQRRLALSRLTGIAVDPLMDPRILNVIQTAHKAEEGTEGGTQGPRAAPQFGSISRPEPTPAQRRAG